MEILITGGAGFIGSHFVRHWREEFPGFEITVLDSLTYAGRRENLRGLIDEIRFIEGTICDPETVQDVIAGTDLVFNFAAESHVDRSIEGPVRFARSNVLGTSVLLEAARAEEVDRFVQVSTDEVYGSTKEDSFTVGDKLEPSSPYSATKAGADHLVEAYHETYGLPTIITRSSNNYGPYQFPEKFIPVITLRALAGEPLPIYGDGQNVRDWLYVRDNCEAIARAALDGTPGEIYNIGSDAEKKNIEVAKTVLDLVGRSRDLIEFVDDRPGHDFRYSLDSQKIRSLGWKPSEDFESGLKRTIDWYKENEWWWRPILDANREAAKG